MGKNLNQKNSSNLPKNLYKESEKVIISFRVTTETSELFHNYCKEQKILKGKFFSFLLEDYFQKNEIKTIEEDYFQKSEIKIIENEN